MKKRIGNIKGFLYEKTREHPAKRYARYWELPEVLLNWAYRDMWIGGFTATEALMRLNFALGDEKIDRHRFGGYIQACKKYHTWGRFGKEQRTPAISESLRKTHLKRLIDSDDRRDLW